MPHGNLLIHLLNKKNAGLRLRPLRCGQIFLSGTLKMLFLPYRHYLMMKKTYSSLTLLENALILLTELEYNLFSGKCFIISDMLAELRRQNNDGAEISDSEQHASASPDTVNIKPVSKVLSPDVNVNDIPVQNHNASIKNREKNTPIL